MSELDADTLDRITRRELAKRDFFARRKRQLDAVKDKLVTFGFVTGQVIRTDAPEEGDIVEIASHYVVRPTAAGPTLVPTRYVKASVNDVNVIPDDGVIYVAQSGTYQPEYGDDGRDTGRPAGGAAITARDFFRMQQDANDAAERAQLAALQAKYGQQPAQNTAGAAPEAKPAANATCKQCGDPMPPGKRLSAVYCSDICRTKASQARAAERQVMV